MVDCESNKQESAKDEKVFIFIHFKERNEVGNKLLLSSTAKSSGRHDTASNVLVARPDDSRYGTYMRGELDAVELTLCDSGGESVRSFIILTADAMVGMATGAGTGEL